MRVGYTWAMPAGIFGGLGTILAILLFIAKNPSNYCQLVTFFLLGIVGLVACIGLILATISQVKRCKNK